MIKITYFVHGTTTDNENNVATGQNQGKLSELGKKQSIELKKQINDNFDVIFCSDLRRAKDSIKLTFGDDKRIKIDKRLRECNYGDLNGAKEEENKKIDPLKGFPNGESYLDVEKRIRSFLKDLSIQYPGKNIAIIAHKATQLALDVIINKKSWKQVIDEDWRKKKEWKPGWVYNLK